MRIDFKKVLFFGLIASMPCLAQETNSDSKEVTMSQPQSKCQLSDDCQHECLGIQNASPRQDKYDYDVYTAGDEEETRCGPSHSCSERCKSCEKLHHHQCERKGAAKVAQED